MQMLHHLLNCIRQAAVYNPEVQAAPSCILWPDHDRQWEAAIPRLQAELPELLVLGVYAPEKRSGPAIWLRCAIAGKVEEVSLPEGCTPILYLPGVSRQDLRAVELCPDKLKPLAELQYRGVLWSQVNAKDWTILAFLKSDQGGLGLDVAQDNETRRAMRLALHRLLEEDVDLLGGKRLDKDFFNTLLTGGDPIRDLLLWLDQGDAFKAGRGENEWLAFVEVCKSQFAFSPERDGLLVGATRLATHTGPWLSVWERFREAPKRYPDIPKQIRKCKMPDLTVHSDVDSHGGWPQWNEAQEKGLRRQLISLQKLPPHEARGKILNLDKLHMERRKLVWAELGESPLARSLEHLAILAEICAHSLTGGNIEDVATTYGTSAWRADDVTLRALSRVSRDEDLQAIRAVVRTIYLPWVEDSARHLQKLVDQTGYPGAPAAKGQQSDAIAGECTVFVDALRFDIAKRLCGLLAGKGFHVEEIPRWAALPTVTATGKPAVSPVRRLISGQEANSDFEPCVTETRHSLKGGYYLTRLLTEAGVTLLGKHEVGDGTGHAWCEFADIDTEGHDHGWKLAGRVDSLLGDLVERVEKLLHAGWKQVRVVTDHGWLLVPGGLPKIDLPSVLSENKWGRCAAIKAGALIQGRQYPWFWNPLQHFALADGAGCYRNGLEFAHGGLSFQECLTLELVISRAGGGGDARRVEITGVTWKGLRCGVTVEGDFTGLWMDVRTESGNASSSIVTSKKSFKENGTASVMVEDDRLAGTRASVLLITSEGELVAQADTVVGGGSE